MEFYRCPDCGYVSSDPTYCAACASEETRELLGDFHTVEDAMGYRYERYGSFA